MGNSSDMENLRTFADQLWKYMVPKLDSKFASNVSYFRAEVVSNPGNNKLEVQRPVENGTLTLPCVRAMSGAQAGQQVVALVMGSMSNAIIVGDGKLNVPGGGGDAGIANFQAQPDGSLVITLTDGTTFTATPVMDDVPTQGSNLAVKSGGIYTALNGKADNAFSNVKVGSTTIVADNKADTLTLVGDGLVNITVDATNDSVTISVDPNHTHDAGDIASGTLPIGRGGTGKSTALEAITALGGLSAADRGTSIAAHTDLNDLTTPGTYCCPNSTRAKTLINAPITSAGFKMFVVGNYNNTDTTVRVTQYIMYGRVFMCRDFSGGASATPVWSDWVHWCDDTHTHAAGDISGILPAARGGTGNGNGYIQIGQKAGTTLGDRATAEGHNTMATGNRSHSEGTETESSGASSHAEGAYTVAGGTGSHAEGDHTTTTVDYAHAEGGYTLAKGNYSHAEGYYTIAATNAQHVFGRYNIEDSQNIEIVGWGTSSARKNIRTLSEFGNEWIAGTLTQASDARLKDVEGEIPDLSKVRAVRFRWKNGDDKEHLGYLAQDVEEIAPYLVGVDSNGYKSLDYIALLTAKVEMLEREIEKLKGNTRN